MPGASRHAKPRRSSIRFGAPVAAAATLAGVAAAFLLLHGAPAAPAPARHVIPVVTTESSLIDYRATTTVRHDVATMESRMVRRVRRRRHAALAAAQHAQQPAAAQPSPPPSPSPAPLSSGGGDAANSPLGECIRNAEEGGSYAWGPGNGGGAYQFLLGTWETYGGAASEFGVAGPAYQNQIFDNAIAAGAASSWTDYDGC